MTSVQPIAGIHNYHAHVYFDGPEQRAQAEALREEIGLRFPVTLGRWHDRLVGPHTRPMYQVAFAVEHFASLVPWLMLNRRGLAVLVHPDTGRPKRDHLVHAIWLGEMLAINDAGLAETDEPEPAPVPNTTPTQAP